jgi:hypothetical protein
MKRLPLFILQDHNFKKKVQWRLFFITVTFFINHAFRTRVAFILINYH